MISYVSNRLFLIPDGDESDPKSKIKNNDHQVHNNDSDGQTEMPVTLKRIPIGFFSSVKLSFQRLCLMAGCNRCCVKCHTRRDKLSHMADKLAKDELKLIRWIQFMRCTNFAMTKLFTV